MLMQLRPPPPRTVRDWTCPHCSFLLGTITPRGLVVLAPHPVFDGATVRCRCPECRHRATFERDSLAA